MRHSIISVILTGIFIGAMFFFVPKLVFGIIIFMIIIRLLHFAFMGHGYYGHGYYGSGRGCEYEYGRGYGSGCDCDREREFHHDHHHHHGFGPIQGPLFHWADKIRNMSEEEFTEFKNKMNKGFGNGQWGKYSEDYRKCKCGVKREEECDCNSTEKKEENTK